MISDKIKKLRKTPVTGIFIDLIPVEEKHLPELVRLRNQEKSKYYLNQQFDLTLEMQKEWYSRYIERDNDIYWCVVTKDGVVIGTYRLYDIFDEICEGGSFIIDENYTMGLPYALETCLLSLEVAFNELDLKVVINSDRKDNKNMNSMSRKLGFEFEKEIMINGVCFNRYLLKKENAKIEKYKALLQSFANV